MPCFSRCLPLAGEMRDTSTTPHGWPSEPLPVALKTSNHGVTPPPPPPTCCQHLRRVAYPESFVRVSGELFLRWSFSQSTSGSIDLTLHPSPTVERLSFVLNMFFGGSEALRIISTADGRHSPGLDGRLVPAGESSPCICSLELSDRHSLGVAVGALLMFNRTGSGGAGVRDQRASHVEPMCCRHGKVAAWLTTPRKKKGEKRDNPNGGSKGTVIRDKITRSVNISNKENNSNNNGNNTNENTDNTNNTNTNTNYNTTTTTTTVKHLRQTRSDHTRLTVYLDR